MALAFYPSFPALVQLSDLLSFGLVDQLIIGLVINTATLAFSLRGLLLLIEDFAPGSQSERLAVFLLLSSPIAFVFHAFHTESLLLAISVWAFVLA